MARASRCPSAWSASRISLVLGILLGGISGYYGGTVDNVIQRVIEFLRSMPTIPLWMGLAAALPMNWPPLRSTLASP